MNVHGKNDPLKFKDRCMDNPPYGLLSIIKIQLEFELEFQGIVFTVYWYTNFIVRCSNIN